MTIFVSVAIDCDVWNFDEASKESSIKSKIETLIKDELNEMHMIANKPIPYDVGVIDIDIEYGDPL
jgi:hypothetical protein